jgi:hypothetical protein
LFATVRGADEASIGSAIQIKHCSLRKESSCLKNYLKKINPQPEESKRLIGVSHVIQKPATGPTILTDLRPGNQGKSETLPGPTAKQRTI